MAEFRKLFYALGLTAMLAGVSSTASAQAINCSRGAGSVPSIIRAESFADLVGDFVLDCTGGTSTLPGQAVPPINIEITLSTNITSKILASTGGGGAVSAGGNFTEALLIIDEPNVATMGVARLTRPLLACGAPGAPYDVNAIGVCRIVSNGAPQQTYDGTPNANGIAALACGADIDGTGAGTATVAVVAGCGRPNVFQGRQGFAQNTGNTNIMLFNGVPFDPPGATGVDAATGHRILRITNIRANSPANLGGFLLQEVRMHINITGVAGITITEPDVRVASVNIGLQTPLPLTHDSDSGITSFVQCLAQLRRPFLRFREGFPSSFKVKGLEQTLANGTYDGASLRYNGTTSSYGTGVINQNVPGANYNTESGFVSTGTNNPSPFNPPQGIGSGNNSTGNGALTNSTGISTAGIATQGTRLSATFTNMPAGMTVSVANIVNLVQSGTNLVTGVAVRTDVVSAHGDGPFSPYTGSDSVVEGSLIVYEVLFADPSVQEDLVIRIDIWNPANQLSSDLPEVNKVAQVAGGFAPFILGTDNTNTWGQARTGSATVTGSALPVPRFRPGSGAQDLFRVNKCSCNLLFPFVTNFATSVGNFDTGIALANTSLTPGASAAALRFGFKQNTSQQGGVQFWYYPSDSTVSPVATQCTNVVATGVCPSPTTGNSAVQAGETLLFSIFGGSGRWGLKPTPGFTGYVIAQASFQYCHAFAYISAQGAGPTTPGMSVGYIALQLDNTNTLPSRTELPSEVLGH